MYTGFIKVQLDLRRPITVKGGGVGGVKGQEAFYLPRGSINTLHISSTNTVRQVIEALLRKFTVADNPAKFALFKRFSREDQGETPNTNAENASACAYSNDSGPLVHTVCVLAGTDAFLK